MKKPYILALASAMFFFGSVSISAQTILDEDFETGSQELYSRPLGNEHEWTTIDSYTGTNLKYKWSNTYNSFGAISGKNMAQCDCPISIENDDDLDAARPREEILLSPEIELNDTYQLGFQWKVSNQAHSDDKKYDFQVRIVENGDVENAKTIFSIQNKEDLFQSGVTEYPFTTWATRTSKLDLSAWKGKKVKLAFVYKMLSNQANVLYLDNIKVRKFNPATTPLGKLNFTTFNFGKIYEGEKLYSDEFTLTNVGTTGLKITDVTLPEGIGLTIDYKTVNLLKNESVKFRLSYTSSFTAPKEGKAVLKTNGGDIEISFTANKQFAPENMIEETFENGFPPTGWKNEGWSESKNYPLEGDASVCAPGGYSKQYITSPRLDLSKGGKVQFTYHNVYETEADDGQGNTPAQNNDIILELSTDGGNTWVEKWRYNYKLGDYGETTEVDLGVGTDNSYVRWQNTEIQVNQDSEVIGSYSLFYLDRVFLPTLYGQGGVPFATTLVSPANNAKDVYNKNIELQWTKAQFADGYKVYVGKSDKDFSVVNGVDVKDATSYTLQSADYEATYYWKVVPYNAKGDAKEATVWNFTILKDASNSKYPYTQDFNGLTELPIGWSSTHTAAYPRFWSILSGYGNPAPSLYNNPLDKGETAEVTSPEFKLPADKQMSISFDWVDTHPSRASIDVMGNAKKQNVEGAPTTVKFEVLADGKWTELSHISQGIDDEKDPVYWIKENISLAAYAGKTVQFRWTHIANNGNDYGAGVDNVVVEAIEKDKAVFNKDGWNAGKVNYNKAVKSGDKFTMFNKGEHTLKVKSVSFDTDNFESTIAAGTEIAKGESLTFSVQFNAKDAAAVVKDNMTVTFESGYSVKFPVEGTALASDALYFSFEDNGLDYNWTSFFNLIDVDKAATTPFNCKDTEFSMNNGVFAFAIAYERPEHNEVAPISGDAFLVTGTPLDEKTIGENWIVSNKLTATANSKFDFYARNWSNNNSYSPIAHKVEVLVSETSNSDRNSFTSVRKMQDIPLCDGNKWNHIEVDLSDYAGKDIHIAVRDYNEKYTQVAFFDDFTFSGFENITTGISAVKSGVVVDGAVTVYNLNGVMVAQGNSKAVLNGLSKGIYVVKVQTANGVKTMKVALK